MYNIVVSTLKITAFWDVMPCSLLKINGRFGGTYRLHLQCRRVSQATNEQNIRKEIQREPELSEEHIASICKVEKLWIEAICSSETSVDTALYPRRWYSSSPPH
jgi:hypothetical protein